MAVFALGLGACASDEAEVVYEEKPVEQLYNNAMDELMAENYENAAKMFDEVERQHPYSQWATKGQLMAAFAYYKKAMYPEATVTLDRFIELHPAHEYAAYAYYLRALCFYERITDVSRDQQMTKRAGDYLEEVIRRFPDSPYAADAEPKLTLVKDQLAGKEMTIGRYYQDRGHYLAAINRFRTVVEDYETTSHVPEALHRLTELYLSLGVIEEARKTAAVLGYNFPDSEWYEDSYSLLISEDRSVAMASGGAPVGAGAPAGEAQAVSTEEDGSFLSRTWDWIF